MGQDPRPVERLYWDMLRRTRQNLGGVTHKAIAGMELALWDIKAKALGVPVYELFGGPLRDRMRLYWSHCGTTRARLGDVLGTPPLRSYADITALGQEVVARGFTALKTNIVIPGEPATVYFPASRAASIPPTARRRPRSSGPSSASSARSATPSGRASGLCLDLNYNFRTEGVLRIAKLLEPFDMQWVEYDNWDPQALLQIKQSTSTRLASCESLVTTRQYRPFLELHAMDVCIIDVPWNGFSQGSRSGGWPRPTRSISRRTTTTATWPTCTRSTSARCCRMCGSWRSTSTTCRGRPTLVTRPPVIKDGHIHLPTGPGWGADIDEKVLRAHPWPGPAAGKRASFYGMSPEQMAARPKS